MLNFIGCFFLITIFGCAPHVSFVQGIHPSINEKQFILNHEKAAQLLRYDLIAWWTTDSTSEYLKKDTLLRSKMGAEWFCVQEGEEWCATYGKWDTLENTYQPAINFWVDTKDSVVIRKRDNPTLPLSINIYAKALHNALPYIGKMIITHKLKLNWYVIPTESTIEVWALPESISPNNYAYYGGEYCYTFNLTGDSLLSKHEQFFGYLGVKPDPYATIEINDAANECPSVSVIFYCLMHKKNFRRIIIHNKNGSTHFAYNHQNKSHSWFHESNMK